MALSVCFILGRLGPSGGVRTVLEHARRLGDEHGIEVAVAVGDESREPGPGPPVISMASARTRNWDLAVCTWWRTAFDLFSVPARRRVYFVQQFDERLYRPGDLERLGAALTHDLPVAFVTEAAWIADLLAELRPEAACHHVPNGVDKDLFPPPAETPERDGALRVTVEGSPNLWYKGVAESVGVLSRVGVPLVTTLVSPEPVPPAIGRAFDRVIGPVAHTEMPALYADTDVVLKLSRVEGVFTPPLEGFHLGATCVVWPVTGHDEYVRHGHNGAVVDFDDVQGTAGWLDLLSRDRALLRRLRAGALETARAWPSWETSASAMAVALAEIATAPAPESGAGTGALLADLDAGLEELRSARLRQQREVDAAREWVEAIRSSRTFRVQGVLQRLLASVRP